MDAVSAFILGLIQGITEFLPISSTGHLIIAREAFLLGGEGGLAFDAVLHFATALAVLVYFRHDFLRIAKTALRWAQGVVVDTTDKYLLLALALGTIPAVLLGLLLEEYMETVFRSAELVAYTLIAGSLVMLGAERFAKQFSEKKRITPLGGVLIGLFQSLALIPGMSRAGMAISGGLYLGLTREESARFAFLLALPLLLGAGGKQLLSLGENGLLSEWRLPLLLGSTVAFAVALLAIHYLLKYVRNHTLSVFIWYRVALAAVILIAMS